MGACITRANLVHYLAAELDQMEIEGLERHVEDCPSCENRLAIWLTKRESNWRHRPMSCYHETMNQFQKE